MNIIVPKVALPQDGKPAGDTVNSVPAESGNPQEIYHLLDQRDEVQIVKALKGQFLDEFVYSFCRRHKWVDGKRPPECTCTDIIVGLSWVGVQEAAREYRGIKVPLEKMKRVETDDLVEISVEAIDTKTGSSRIGTASQQKKMRLKTGIINDEFCVAKAVAKAQRNAIRPLLPVTLIKAWIEAHRNGGTHTAIAAEHPHEKLPAPDEPKAVLVPSSEMPTAPKPANNPVVPGNRTWFPSVGQVKRIFGLAHGSNVSRGQIAKLLKTICGVDDPARIDSRVKYEELCNAIQGVPF